MPTHRLAVRPYLACELAHRSLSVTEVSEKKAFPECAWHATVLQTIVSASEK